MKPHVPMVHSNGTAAKDLISPLSETTNAIRTALEKLYETAPNMRDYYVKENGQFDFRLARDLHVSRIGRLESVINELDEIAVEIVDQTARRL